MQANSYSSPGKLGGNIEDVRGILTTLEPETTPFLSSIRKVAKAKAAYVEVGVDTLDKPKRKGTREGTASNRGGNKAKDRARIGAYCQRWVREFSVSDVQQIITERGGNAFTDDELGDSEAKAWSEHKRDIEATLLSDQDHSGGSDGEMECRGFFMWTGGGLPTNNLPGSCPAIYQTPAAMRLTGVAALTESGANSIAAWLQAARSATGRSKKYVGLCGLDYAANVDATFTGVDAGVASRKFLTTDMGDKHEIDMTVRSFKTSMGQIDFMASDFALLTSDGDATSVTTKNIAIYDPELWLFDQLFPSAIDEENEDGGGNDGRIKCIGSLLTLTPKGSGFIRN